MNIDSFKMLVNTYGSDSDRWPNKVQQAAIALLEKEPQANEYFLHAAQLDECLEKYKIHDAPISLQNNIFHCINEISQHRASNDINTLSSKLAMLGLCALTGFLLAKAPFIFHLFQYENALMFIQFEQIAFQQNEE